MKQILASVFFLLALSTAAASAQHHDTTDAFDSAPSSKLKEPCFPLCLPQMGKRAEKRGPALHDVVYGKNHISRASLPSLDDSISQSCWPNCVATVDKKERLNASKVPRVILQRKANSLLGKLLRIH